MKLSFIYWFAVILMLFSCQSSDKKSKELSTSTHLSFTEKYTDKVNQELEKAKMEQESKILLGFELGMNEEAYKSKFDELVEQSVLKPLIDFKDNSKFASYSADTTDFFYPLEINKEFYPLHFVPVFEEEKLTTLSAKISPKLGETKTESLYKSLVELYSKKYGKDYLERINMYKSNDFIWLILIDKSLYHLAFLQYKLIIMI